MNEPPSIIVYRNLEQFIAYRKITTKYKFLTPEQFSTEFNTMLYICIDGTDRDGNPIYIFLIQPKSKYERKTEDFKKLVNSSVKNKKNCAILYITEQKVSNYINKKIETFYASDNISVYTYTYNNFIIVLPQSVSSSLHQIITKEELAEYTTRLIIEPNDLAKIQVDDPQLIWIGAKVGDVIRITGKSDTAQIVEEYRLVI